MEVHPSRSYRTRGGYVVRLNHAFFPWNREDFAWLGTIELGSSHVIGWAWHKDGRSIDREDRGFDLVEQELREAA